MSIYSKHHLIIAVCIHVLLSSVSQTKTEPPLYPTKFIYAGTLTPNGYTITKPGYYTLCEEVEFTSSNTTAITIDSDYVILNLNYKTIYQLPDGWSL